MSILTSAKTISFVLTTDRARAKAFYTGVLGFTLTGEDDFAAVFDMNGTMLRMSAVPGHVAHAHTVLGWEVADIEAAVRALRDAGVTFTIHDGFGQNELGIWAVPGSATKVAWFVDPDGNGLSVTQF